MPDLKISASINLKNWVALITTWMIAKASMPVLKNILFRLAEPLMNNVKKHWRFVRIAHGTQR